MTSLLPKLEEKLRFQELCQDKEQFPVDYRVGRRQEHARLTDVHKALVKCVEALEHFEAIGNMGYEDTVMTFLEDPSNIDFAKEALKHLREVLET